MLIRFFFLLLLRFCLFYQKGFCKVENFFSDLKNSCSAWINFDVDIREFHVDLILRFATIKIITRVSFVDIHKINC